MPRSLVAFLLLLGLILPGLADEPAKKPEPKKEPSGGSEDQMDKDAGRTLKDVLKQLAKQMGFQPRGNRNGAGFGRFPLALAEARLGAGVEKPSEVLAERFNLAKGQGIVLQEVRADSAAAKAGLTTNDILLELNGKPVPSDPQDFAKMIDDLKARTPVDALVLRTGRKETIHGLTLPEPDPNALLNNRVNRWNGRVRGSIPELPGTSSMTIERSTGGGFLTRYQEGKVAITITGKTADGKTRIDEIEIVAGGDTKKYRSVEEVPDDFRDDVKHLIRKTEKDARP